MTQFNKGDRIRYTGGHPRTNELSLIGELGTVLAQTGATNVNVRMDKAEINGNQSGLRGFFPENLEILPMPKSLDLTQPLVLLTRGGDPKPVKFLAKTEAGDIMVDTHGIGKDSHWMQFTTDGTFLRAALAGGSASALKLVNEEPKVTHRFTAQLVDGAVYFSPHQGIGGDVQVTTQGDKIVSIVATS